MKFGRVVIGMIALLRPTKIGAYGLLDEVKVRDIILFKRMELQALMEYMMDYTFAPVTFKVPKKHMVNTTLSYLLQTKSCW